MFYRQRIIDEFLSKTSQIQQKWQGENLKMKEQEERFYVGSVKGGGGGGAAHTTRNRPRDVKYFSGHVT